MTEVTVSIADIVAEGTTVPARGFLTVALIHPVIEDQILTVNPFHVSVVDGVASFEVEPIDGNGYVVTPRYFPGLGAWYFVIPDTPSISLADLIEDHQIDPDSLAPVTSAPTVAARIAEIQEQIDGLEGADPEVIEAVVIAYLEENPPAGGTVTAVNDVEPVDGVITLAPSDIGAQVAGDYATSSALTSGLSSKADVASPAFTGTVSGITKSMVGLGNVDNTSDASKPVSTLQAAADATVLSSAATAAASASKSADTITDGTTNKAFLATERTKLAGIATAATANDTDVNLKARANHTGTQTASTISDFSTAADARVVAGITGKADLASPALTGNPTAPTQAADNNSTRIATTAYVQTELADYAVLASPALTGNPTAPTQAADNSSTRIATTAYVQGELADRPQSTEVLVIDKITQAAYDALTPVSTTLYIIVG